MHDSIYYIYVTYIHNILFIILRIYYIIIIIIIYAYIYIYIYMYLYI